MKEYVEKSQGKGPQGHSWKTGSSAEGYTSGHQGQGRGAFRVEVGEVHQ